MTITITRKTDMTVRTLLTIETAADIARSVVEYAMYAVFFGVIGIGWIVT